MTALKVWCPGNGRDYALMPNGDVLSVNAVGLRVMDVRWPVVQYGEFVGDLRDAECLRSAGYQNVERNQQIVRPPADSSPG